MTNTKLTMYAWETNVSATVFAVQGESLSRSLEITLVEDRGDKGPASNAEVVNKPLNLAGISAPRLYVSKPDGKTVFFDGAVKDAAKGVVTFTLPAQALAAGGEAACQIVLSRAGGETLKVIGLTLDIRQSALDDAIESSDEYDTLTELVARVERVEQDAAAWLADAQKQHEALLDANSKDLAAWLAEAKKQIDNMTREAASIVLIGPDATIPPADRAAGTLYFQRSK